MTKEVYLIVRWTDGYKPGNLGDSNIAIEIATLDQNLSLELLDEYQHDFRDDTIFVKKVDLTEYN